MAGNTRKRSLILWIAGAAAALVAVAAIARNPLRAWAFARTGEESAFGQARGLAQLALNLTHPPLDLAPYAEIEHGGVNPFGINTFLHHEVEPEKRERQMALIAGAGFHWIRQEFPWEDIEVHGRGDFVDRRNDPAGVDAWAKYDQIVELADEYDIEIIARLSNPPAWSRAAGNDMGAHAPPDDYDDYAAFAGTVAARYRGQIRYFQVWNEPNIYPEWGELPVSPEGYADLLCRAYDAIKAANPDAVVISAALAPTLELNTRNFNDLIFLQRMYDAGAGDCFDVLATQGYGLWSGPTDERLRALSTNYARIAYLRDMMVKNGDAEKAIWITEMNWNAAPEDVEPRYGRVTLQQQADYAPMAYQRAQEEWPWAGVINFWYFKRAAPDWLEERRPEAYFQMADPDFNLMPVYDTMKDYTSREPAMYMGNHPASHWAVDYGAGWEAYPGEYGEARSAQPSAEAVTFRFEGAALAVVVDGAQGDAIRVRVDGGEARTLPAGEGEQIAWRGRRGTHTVEIEAVGEPIVARYVVRAGARIPTGEIIAAGVALLAVAFAAWKRINPGGASTGKDNRDAA
jgi:hypothetical protein